MGGSGAVCASCRLCQCKQAGHVPDILGHRCGPPLLLGDRCSHVMDAVCNGELGLQCGHVCDFYKDNLNRIQECGCSQMHVQDGDLCKPSMYSFFLIKKVTKVLIHKAIYCKPVAVDQCQ